MLGQQYHYATASLPTQHGTFTIRCYQDEFKKDHVAIFLGEVSGKEKVFTRIHSECFTGDILGSHRCDCGTQLQAALKKISEERLGVLIYLRQEGRGIGLLNKIRAYAIQDEKKLDTFDANLHLGFSGDERTYEMAAFIIQDLGIQSINLNTNNPKKKMGLETYGVNVSDVSPSIPVLTQDNVRYLQTKKNKMGHQIDAPLGLETDLCINAITENLKRPKITLSYAQTLNGSIAARDKGKLEMSCHESLVFVHDLRAKNEAILVGIDTVLIDDPSLTVRLTKGSHPQPIILDSRLRIPVEARVMMGPKRPWIFTSLECSRDKKLKLERLGARVFTVEQTENKLLELRVVMAILNSLGVHSILVEGGSKVITELLNEHLVDQFFITISPQYVNGFNVLGSHFLRPFKLENITTQLVGRDIVVGGKVSSINPEA